MENLKIRAKLKEKEVHQWEVAEKLGVAEMTFTRKMRRELPEEEQQKIFSIIDEIAKEKNNKEN